MDTGESAFPVVTNGNGFAGMTLLDWFAINAPEDAVAAGADSWAEEAENRYQFAAAMIAEKRRLELLSKGGA